MKASTELLSLKKSVEDFKKKGIYFLLHGDEVVYVGKTIVGIVRVQSHIGHKPFTHYCFIDFPNLTEEELLAVETKYILKYEPPLNGTISLSKSEYTSLHRYNLHTNIDRKILNSLVIVNELKPKKVGNKVYYNKRDLNKITHEIQTNR